MSSRRSTALRPRTEVDVVIALTRTSGEPCALDPAHIERVETSPTTVVHLTDGARYCVTDTLDEIVDRIRHFRAGVMTTAWRIVDSGPEATTGSPDRLTPALTGGGPRPL
jgi:flagellar protein FlbD